MILVAIAALEVTMSLTHSVTLYQNELPDDLVM